jgi:signal transduction histidine kinase
VSHTPVVATATIETVTAGTIKASELGEVDSKALQQIINTQQQEIKKLQQALEAKVIERTTALEEAQALTHLGSWQWDVATGRIAWSDELYRIYGLPPQDHEVGFEEFMSMIHPADRARVSNIIGSSAQSAEPFEFEHRIILPDKTERVLHGMGKVITDPHGKPMRMLGTSQDITEAHRLERAKDEFISLVSHQLRTPLTIIRLYGNMLTDGIAGPLEKKQAWYVNKITNASIRLIKLVGDILNISRLELNRIKIEAKPADANQLIQTHLEELAPIANSKGVTIRFTPEPNLGKTPIDATIFGEIIHNLAGNAVRYCRDKGGEVTVRFTKEARGYMLTVKDNGIGIPKAAQGHIFERFYRASNANKVDGEGTGPGLYLVKLFTETAGGQTWFTSAANKGTTFYVLFPPDGMVSRLSANK